MKYGELGPTWPSKTTPLTEQGFKELYAKNTWKQMKMEEDFDASIEEENHSKMIQLLTPHFEWRIFQYLKKYNSKFAIGDLIGGISLVVILLPQAMAYALLTDVPPAVGLYSCLLPPIMVRNMKVFSSYKIYNLTSIFINTCFVTHST